MIRDPRFAMPRIRTACAAVLTAGLLALAGCAGPAVGRAAPADDSVASAGAGPAARSAVDADEAADGSPRRRAVDPLEPLNRRIHAFNEVLDDALFRPVARLYDRWTPQVVRMIARNFLSNLLDPYIAFNSFLQGKPADGFTGLGRFAFNTAFGFFGFGDPASEAGYAKRREDFGQTLGVWGVPPGPYLVLPLFGPSSVRDGVGFGVDGFLGLVNRFDNVAFRNSMAGLGFVETRAALLPADRLLQDALDRYLLVRDAYLQRRRSLVYDGNPPDED